MKSPKEHYDSHLGNFYSWMAGDFPGQQDNFRQFLASQHICPTASKVAIDLGAGNGAHSAALATLGYRVKAIDFNHQLLEELKTNTGGMNVEVINNDIQRVAEYKDQRPELILCMGDTIAHLESEQALRDFFDAVYATLLPNGTFIVSFRDYSVELKGDDRFIPVKSDADRILTCFLEYQPDHVIVSDLLYEKTGDSWHQKVSSYQKLRISPANIQQLLSNTGFNILYCEPLNRLIHIVAIKPQ